MTEEKKHTVEQETDEGDAIIAAIYDALIDRVPDYAAGFSWDSKDHEKSAATLIDAIFRVAEKPAGTPTLAEPECDCECHDDGECCFHCFARHQRERIAAGQEAQFEHMRDGRDNLQVERDGLLSANQALQAQVKQIRAEALEELIREMVSKKFVVVKSTRLVDHDESTRVTWLEHGSIPEMDAHNDIAALAEFPKETPQ